MPLRSRLPLQGLYRLTLPTAMRHSFRHAMVGDAVPLAIRGQAEESRLGALTKADIRQAQEHLNLVVVETAEDLKTALHGGALGWQLWKYMALAMLAVVLLEIALTRWIAVQRKTTTATSVDFGSDDGPSIPKARVAATPELVKASA